MAKHIFRFIGHLGKDGKWVLRRDECHHISKVLRIPPGSIIEVTDGTGRWTQGILEVISKDEAVVMAAEDFVDPRPQYQLAIALAATKSKGIDDILPSIVELGVDHIFVCQTQSGGAYTLTEKAYARWLKIVEEALKQCKRCWLPQLTVCKHPKDLVENSFFRLSQNKYFCDSSCTESLMTTRFLCGDTIIMLGNEHGLDDATIDLLRSRGCVGTRLTDHILRAGTAAIAATTIATLRRNALQHS